MFRFNMRNNRSIAIGQQYLLSNFTLKICINVSCVIIVTINPQQIMAENQSVEGIRHISHFSNCARTRHKNLAFFDSQSIDIGIRTLRDIAVWSRLYIHNRRWLINWILRVVYPNSLKPRSSVRTRQSIIPTQSYCWKFTVDYDFSSLFCLHIIYAGFQTLPTCDNI